MNGRDLPENLRVYEIVDGPAEIFDDQRYRTQNLVRILATGPEEAFKDYITNHLSSDERNFYEEMGIIVGEGKEFMVSIRDVTDECDYVPITKGAIEQIIKRSREE